MTFKKIINLTEPASLIATLLPFILGLLFVSDKFGCIKIIYSIILLVACLLIQMFTNVIDNLSDYQRSFSTNAKEFRETTNSLGVNNITIKEAAWTAIVLGISVIILGTILVIAVTPWILIIGVIGFVVAIVYSAGSKPITNTPFGEIASGLAMGLGIVYSVMLINVPTYYFNWNFFLDGLIVSGLAIFSIANIMLANNICDEAEDIKLKRHTLVSIIGKENALILFATNYLLAFSAMIVAVIFGMLPPIIMIVILAVPQIIIRTKMFFKIQVKKKTFILAIKNANEITLLVTIAGIVQVIISLT